MRQAIIHNLVRPRFDSGVVKRVLVVVSDRSDSHTKILEDLHAKELKSIPKWISRRFVENSVPNNSQERHRTIMGTLQRGRNV